MALCLPSAAACARTPRRAGATPRRPAATPRGVRRCATRRGPLRVAATATVEPPPRVAAPPPPTPAATPLDTLQSSLAALSSLAASPLRAQYASAQALRFAYFLTQGVVNARLVLRTDLDAVAIARTLLRVLTAAPGTEPLTGSDLLGRPLSGPEAAKMSAFWEENLRAVIGLFQEEMASIEAGVYKLPYDLSPLGPPAAASAAAAPPGPLGGLLAALPLPPLPALAPQWDPVRVAATAAAYMRDQAAVAQRREAKNGQEVQAALDPAAADRYPKYFLQNFHWQSGGWLSAESAELYDYQVETLFLGSADAMRRRALPALSRFASQPRFAGGMRLFDAATGTGRFLSFVLDSFDNVRAVASDLSPYYLNKAKEVLKPWNGRVESYLEANVEAIPLPDASFDAVTCVYLFHELPGAARRAAAAEFARLLRPGGRLFFVDSAQRGDGERSGMPTANDMALDGFPKFSHEPYYAEYTRENLTELFGAAGLRCVEAESSVAWVTKVMVFEKPAEGEAPPAPPAAAAEAAPAVEVVTPDATIAPGDAL